MTTQIPSTAETPTTPADETATLIVGEGPDTKTFVAPLSSMTRSSEFLRIALRPFTWHESHTHIVRLPTEDPDVVAMFIAFITHMDSHHWALNHVLDLLTDLYTEILDGRPVPLFEVWAFADRMGADQFHLHVHHLLLTQHILFDGSGSDSEPLGIETLRYVLEITNSWLSHPGTGNTS
jgi:hypothetical protein